MKPAEDNVAAEVRSLAEAVCTGSITPGQCERLNALLLDEEAALTYAVYLRMHGLLCRHWQEQSVVVKGAEMPAVELSAGNAPLSFLGSAYQGTVGFFSQTMPFSYLTATLILGVMLLSAWAYKISRDQQFVETPARATIGLETPRWVSVGRVTGMKDCRWSDPSTAVYLGSSVPLGRKYALSAGLMQITYDSGAKVILDGPCKYEVDSNAGGYLAMGKLTARVAKKGSGARGQGSGSEATPSSFIPHPSSFVVKTPTAVVTDLGTEFGVQVNDEGNTTSRVFVGTVKVRTASEKKEGGTVLRANESVALKRIKPPAPCGS